MLLNKEIKIQWKNKNKDSNKTKFLIHIYYSIPYLFYYIINLNYANSYSKWIKSY